MPASPSDKLRLRVLGVHTPSGGLAVEVEDTGARRVLHEGAAPDRVGPLATSVGPRWLGPWSAPTSLWDVVVAHARGLPPSAVVAGLRQLTGVVPVDPEAVWLDAEGAVARTAVGGTVGLDGVARYLLCGETAHESTPDDPDLVSSLARSDAGALAGDADLAAWREAVRAAAPDVVDPEHPQRGSSIEVGGAGPDRAAVRRALSGSGVLLLLLGLASGGMLAPRPAPTDLPLRVEVPGAAWVEVTCSGEGSRLALPGAGACRIEAELGGVVHVGRLDTRGPRMYECRAREGELACAPR